MMKLTSACSGCFAGLSCGTRMEIITLLQKKKQISVLEITKHFKLTQPTVSHHLKFLEEVGLLTSKKEGRKVFYTLNPDCDNKDCHIFE